MTRALILTAAGSSSRMGGTVKKEYLPLEAGEPSGITVLSAALYAFLSTCLFTPIVITVPSDGESEAREILAKDARIRPLLYREGITFLVAPGGSTRQESVRFGLKAIADSSSIDGPAVPTPDVVLIHDAARPWVSERVIRAVVEGTELHGASVPAIPSVDTQKETDETGRIVRHLERAKVVSVQTPQGFRFRELLAAHERAAGDGFVYTDDTEIWGKYAGDIFVCEGDRENRKITYREDLR